MSKLAKAELLPALTNIVDPARLERIKINHAAMRKTFEYQIDLATFVGIDLLQVKEAVGHGNFMAWREAHLPDITHRSCTRYMDFVLKLDAMSNLGFQSLLLTEGELPLTVRTNVQQAIRKIGGEGKTWTALYRDLGLVADPPATGGFRPPDAAVQKWLKKHHPELAGTKFADLPEPVRKQFQKQFKPDAPSAAMRAEAARARFEKCFEELSELMDSKDWGYADETQRITARDIAHDAHEKLCESLTKKKGKAK